MGISIKLVLILNKITSVWRSRSHGYGPLSPVR